MTPKGGDAVLRRFARYYRPHWRLLLLDMGCVLLLAACGFCYPMITRAIINRYVPAGDLHGLLFWSAVLFGIYLLRAGLTYVVQYYGHLMGMRIQVDIRQDAFDHLQRLPFSYFDGTKTGTIMSRIINDTYEISEFAHHGPENLMISGVMLVGSFLLLTGIDPLLTLVIFAFIPLLVWFASGMRLKLADTSMKSRIQVGEVNAELQNSVTGVRVSRAFDAARFEKEQFAGHNRAYMKARGRYYLAMARFFSGTGFIMDVLYAVTVLGGGLCFFWGRINIGDYAAYLLFAGQFTEPIRKLITFIEQCQTGLTGFERVGELMSVPPERDDDGAVALEDARGDIRFEGVRFSYGGEEVLCGVDLDIRAGQTVALVGPSGGGKSTLCHLIPRFYEPTAGGITLDGFGLRHYTLGSLRRQIGIVQQDTFLFTGTIRDNIAYGRVDATDDEIAEAARRADIHDFIVSLPDGYRSFVGERGVKLSGGQRQRVAIARAFLKNPPVLILDEATSSLDTVTERNIQSALEQLSSGRTTLTVAHRLSAVRHADRIVVLDKGGVAESGTHDELLAQNGVYARLWRAQANAEGDA